MTWPIVALGEIAEVVRGVTYKKEHVRDAAAPGLLPLLRATNIGHGLDLETGLVYVPSTVVNETQKLLSGDIVLASSSGSISVVGKSARLSRPWEGTFGAFCAVLRAKDTVDPSYLAHYVQSHEVRTRWSDAARGTNINNLKRGDLTDTPVPLPPLEEQRSIVDLLEGHLSHLDAADAYIDASRRRLKAMERSALSELRMSLADAPWRAIGSVAQTALGKMLDAARQTGTQTRYLRNINVRWGAFDVDDLHTTPLTTADVERFSVIDGDVFACEGGEPGRCAVWRGDGAGIAYQKALHRLRVRDPEELAHDFLALMLTEAIKSGRSAHLYTGTTIKHLPQEKLRQIEIPVPDLATQHAKVAAAVELDESRALLEQSLAVLDARSAMLRRSLLAAAFSGRLTGDTELSEVEGMIPA